MELNSVNSLPSDKFLRLVQIISICRRQNKCNLKNRNYFQGWVENIAGKGENAGYQHFLLFPQCFQKASSAGSSKVAIVW